jgi:hypothetical protein
MVMQKYVVFVVALLVWGGLFYVMDRSIMQAQDLPVGADLMPR